MFKQDLEQETAENQPIQQKGQQKPISRKGREGKIEVKNKAQNKMV